MPVSIRILLVEDSDDDAAIVVDALRRSGYDPRIVRVADRAAYLTALDAGSTDAIISEHSMSPLSSATTLALMHGRSLDLPFIVVSKTIDEDAAVAILKAGAHDFVTKHNLARLGPALQRQLQDARHRAELAGARSTCVRQRRWRRSVSLLAASRMTSTTC